MFSNSRRHFMRTSVGATLAALTGSEARLLAGPKIEPRADSVILLWMAGGMAQTETFDPKRSLISEDLPGSFGEYTLAPASLTETTGA